MSIEVVEFRQCHREWARGVLSERWAGPRIVTRGRVHQADLLPGFVAVTEGEPVGLLTYRIARGECEIVSLDAIVQGRGVGTLLIDAVRTLAGECGCKRVWLITTNDNTAAQEFHRKRGLRTVAVHSGAITESRKLKPEIPELGIDGVPIRDEIEMELRLEELGASRRNQAQLDLIGDLVTECETRNLRVWLFGGWGIDALLGSVTREHSDIDILAEAGSRDALRAALEHIGGEISTNGTGWRFDRNEIGVDIGFLVTRPDGIVVSDVDPADPNVYPWPPGSFPEECNGSLSGRPCRAISWEAQYVARAGFKNAFPDTTPRVKDKVYLEMIERHVSAGARREIEDKWFGGIPRGGPSLTFGTPKPPFSMLDTGHPTARRLPGRT